MFIKLLKYIKKHKKLIIAVFLLIGFYGIFKISQAQNTLPCGVKINFSSSVRNDLTGRLRLATTSDGISPFSYALEYYEKYFKSDDEIHAIWDATRKTTTRLIVVYGNLQVTTFSYVKGEERDAKLLFSGHLQSDRTINLSTGKEIKG